MAAVLRKLTKKGLMGVIAKPNAVMAGGQPGKTMRVIRLEVAAMVQKSSRLHSQPKGHQGLDKHSLSSRCYQPPDNFQGKRRGFELA